MQLELDPKEMASALAAIQSLMKKMPGEIATNDAPVAILLDNTLQYQLVAAFDWFNVCVPLYSMKATGQNDVILPWTGGRLSISNLLGIVDDSTLQKTLSKVDKKKFPTVILEYNNGDSEMVLKIGVSNFFKFAVNDPKKVLSNYGNVSDNITIMDMTEDEMTSFCEMTGELANIISPSVSKIVFGCVCLSSEPNPNNTDELVLRMSGNSEVEGFSVICNTKTPCFTEFTALIPKKLAEGMKAFIKCFSSITKPKVGVVLDDQKRAKELVLSTESFTLWLSCMVDDFPFRSIDGILNMISTPVASCIVPTKDFKNVLTRTSTVGKGPRTYSIINVLDSGVLQIRQLNSTTISDIAGTENMESERLIEFPSDTAEVLSVVDTSIIKKAINFFHDDFFYLSLNAKKKGIVCLSTGEDVYNSLDCVLLGINYRE